MIKRILILSVILVVIISLMIIPVSAAYLDYNNYIDHIWVDGDNDVITLKFPNSGVWFLRGDTQRYSDVLEIYSAASSLSVVYDPFRYPDNSQDYLLRSDFPNDTTYELWFTASGVNHINSASIEFYQLDISGNVIEHTTIPAHVEHVAGTQDDIFYRCFYDSTFNFHDSCYSFLMYYVFDAETANIDSNGIGHYKFFNANFEFTFSINSLLRQQMLSNKTNNILGAVENQLADNGQKLDDIINGNVTPEAPDGSGTVDDLDDVESGLRDDAQAGLDDGVQLQQSAFDVILTYLAAFNAIGLIFNLFADLPFFSALLAVSLSLGIFGLLVNLGNQLAHHGSTKAHKEGKSKSSKGKGG